MELTSSFALLLSVVIDYLLIVKGLHYQIDIFNFGIIVTLIGAIFNFYIVKFLELFHKANSLLIMQVEYYIQWATLFLTLYQFLTGSKTNMKTVINSGLSNQTIDINILNLAVLPLLLVSWISISMIKIYLTDHKSAK
ncbi:conserved membrane hypothetical protein [Weissella viridescens]|nr:conserved membrane hypothetical protein [Weissella viridescens]